MGWNAGSRRAVQYGYNLLGQPPQFHNGVDQWRGPHGVISKLLEYARLSGTRQRKNVKQILINVNQLGSRYDAGNRVRMQCSRKRKLTFEDACFGGKMLRRGVGATWATTYVNNKRITKDDTDAVDRTTLMRTLKRKYNAKCHRRQTKATGSKSKQSAWAQSRYACGKQFLHQLKLGIVDALLYYILLSIIFYLFLQGIFWVLLNLQ